MADKEPCKPLCELRLHDLLSLIKGRFVRKEEVDDVPHGAPTEDYLMASRIVQYFKDKLHTIKEYPITVTRAVFDDNGKRLDDIINDSLLSSDEEEFSGVEPRDADTLGGKPADDFVVKDDNFIKCVDDETYEEPTVQGSLASFPFIYYDQLPSGSNNNETYMKELLQYLDENGYLKLGRTLVGAIGPNYQGWAIIYGLPGRAYVNVTFALYGDSKIYRCGYNNGSWYYTYN